MGTTATIYSYFHTWSEKEKPDYTAFQKALFFYTKAFFAYYCRGIIYSFSYRDMFFPKLAHHYMNFTGPKSLFSFLCGKTFL
jgi:hypothetical protein